MLHIRPVANLSVIVVLGLYSGSAAAKPEGEKDDRTESPGLGEEGELRKAISLYDTGQYEQCVDAFQLLLDSEEKRRLRSPSKIETAQVYHGSCLIGVGRTLEAEAIFRRAILENPQMKTPDSLLFPESVVELFLRVRESMLDEIRKSEQKRMKDAEDRANREQELRSTERTRVEQLTKLASQEVVVERRERYLAFVPFGVGQFQNKQDGLGWLFLGSEAAALAVLGSSLYMTAWYGAKSSDLSASVQQLRDYSTAQHNAYVVSTIGGWSFVGLAVLGIVEANLSFRPETPRTRQRELPQPYKPLEPVKRATMPSFSVGLLPGRNASYGLSMSGEF